MAGGAIGVYHGAYAATMSFNQSAYLASNCYYDGAWKYLHASSTPTGLFAVSDVITYYRKAAGTNPNTISWDTVLTTTTASDLTVTGNVTAYSDRRVKENVEVIHDAMKLVRQLTGYTYNRTDIEGKPRQMGLIAQEVEGVVPEVVQHDENDRYSLAYGNLVALLIEAVKEQDERIRRLEREVLIAKGHK
jgi:hypothetical protein